MSCGCNCGCCSHCEQQCYTYRLRDLNDCTCQRASATEQTTFYGKVVSGSGQFYVVDLYDDGPLEPSTGSVNVMCPNLIETDVLPAGYELIVTLLVRSNIYIALPSVLVLP